MTALAEERTVLCYGDSNTWGTDPGGPTRFARDVRWPGVLARELGPAWHVVEEGLPGRTIATDDPLLPGRNGLSHLGPTLLSHRPLDVVVLALGTNDLKAAYGLGAPEIASAARALVTLTRATLAGAGDPPPRMVLVCPPPLAPVTDESEFWGFGRALEESKRLARFYAIAADREGIEFLDAGTVIESSREDGVHWEPEAHARIGRALAMLIVDLTAVGTMT
jgi:lysophospholipase L1-like esterase